MLLLITFLICIFAALGSCVMGAWSDFKGLKIANIYTVVVLVSFGVAFGVLSFANFSVFFSVTSHLISALIVFGVTALMFSFGALGAADSKLGTAVALWVGLKGLPVFLFWMAVSGGILGVSALIIKKRKPFASTAENSWIDQLQKGQSKVPYGIAIAVGAVVAFVQIGYLDLATFQRFLSL